jgi:maltose-binding protein MalE
VVFQQVRRSCARPAPRTIARLPASTLLACAGVALALLGGCRARTEHVAQITVGTYWGGTAAEVLHRELLEVAHDLGTVTIDVRTFTLSGLSDYLFESQPRSAGGDMIDLMIVPNDWLGRLAQRRLIAEVPTARVERLQQSLVRQAMLTVSDGDRVLGYPIAAEVIGLVYDPARFPSPPRDLNEIIDADLPPDTLPLALDLSKPSALAPLVSAYQGLLVGQDGDFVWRASALQEVMTRLRPVWATPMGWQVCRGSDLESLQLQLFLEGRLASFFAGPWLLETLEQSGHAFAVAPIPPFADAAHPARALIGYQCVAISRSSHWVDLALDIAERLCSRDVNERISHETRLLPVLLASYQSEDAMASPGMVGFLRAIEEGQLFPSQARWSDSFQRAADRLQRFVSSPDPPSPAETMRLLSGATT